MAIDPVTAVFLAKTGFDLFNGLFGKKKSGGGGGSFGVDLLEPLLSQGQENEVVSRLMSYNDTPNQPLGRLSRSTLMERMQPGYVPEFFRNDVLNPFLQAQFRLGREQLDRDLTSTQEQFQRLGAYFSPDLPSFMSRLTERQNLAEQDYLGNLGFQGAQLAEELRTDAIARALGLETQTAGVLDQLLARQNERERTQLGFLGGLQGGGGEENTMDPLGSFLGALGPQLQSVLKRQPAVAPFSTTSPFTDDSNLNDSLLSRLNFQNFKKSLLPT